MSLCFEGKNSRISVTKRETTKICANFGQATDICTINRGEDSWVFFVICVCVHRNGAQFILVRFGPTGETRAGRFAPNLNVGWRHFVREYPL